MLTLSELANLQLGIYHRAVVAWDWCEVGSADNHVVWGAKHIDGIWYIALRGSTIPLDWLRDFAARPTWRVDIGWCHHGFQVGLAEAWMEIKAFTHCTVATQFFFIGHSLGAARATLLAAIAIADGATVVGRVCWGEPRPGFEKIAGIVNKGLEGKPNLSFVNGMSGEHDLVTDVPTRWPLKYRHVNDLIPVTAPPPANDRWGLLKYHHMELYASGMVRRSWEDPARQWPVPPGVLPT